MSGVNSLVSSTKSYKLFQEKYFSAFHFILPYAGYEVFLISGPECNKSKPPMLLRLVKTSLDVTKFLAYFDLIRLVICLFLLLETNANDAT